MNTEILLGSAKAETADGIETEELVDIADVDIDVDLPIEDRIRSFIEQVRNPYQFKCNGLVVSVEFAGQRPIEDCIKRIGKRI